MSHPRLRREVNDPRKAVLFEQVRHALAIGKVEFDKAYSVGFCQLRAAGFLQHGVVVGIQVINADDISPVAHELPGNMESDEAGSSGHENRTVSHQSCLISRD